MIRQALHARLRSKKPIFIYRLVARRSEVLKGGAAGGLCSSTSCLAMARGSRRSLYHAPSLSNICRVFRCGKILSATTQ